MMSSELPVYAVVDKSRKNRDEPVAVENETYIDIPDKDALQFPAQNTLLKKKPPTVSPYKPAKEKSDTLSKEKQETAIGVANTLIRSENTLSTGLSKYIATSSLAVIIAVMIIVTFIVSIVAVTVRSDVAALQEQLSIVQQNLSESIVNSREEEPEEQLLELRQNVSRLNFEILELKTIVNCPPFISSCARLLSSCPSGYYWVRASNGSVVHVYCDMTLSCGGVTGGWMRVAELNMTNTSQQCPSGLMERNETGLRQCRIPGNECFSVYHSTSDVSYSRVCGRITAYQVGSTNAFHNEALDPSTSVDSNYVDGVSLTHGTSPRHHIWTFAAALGRTGNHSRSHSYCPCQNTTHTKPPMIVPDFVGEDFFCDAGDEVFLVGDEGLQTDPLWDGTDCLCCDNPPWFYKQLPQPTTDDIEMRVCKDEYNENIAITQVKIYVQ